MNNYKLLVYHFNITNKKRNKTYFLNEEELINFFKESIDTLTSINIDLEETIKEERMVIRIN